MDIVKKISTIFFYITIIAEFLFNLLIIGAFFYKNIMVAFIYIYAIVLIAWLIISLVFAIKGKWGKALFTSSLLAIILIGCGYAQPRIEPLDFDNAKTLLLTYHIHIFIDRDERN